MPGCPQLPFPQLPERSSTGTSCQRWFHSGQSACLLITVSFASLTTWAGPPRALFLEPESKSSGVSLVPSPHRSHCELHHCPDHSSTGAPSTKNPHPRLPRNFTGHRKLQTKKPKQSMWPRKKDTEITLRTQPRKWIPPALQHLVWTPGLLLIWP